MKFVDRPIVAATLLLCVVAFVLLVPSRDQATTVERSGVTIVDGAPPPDRRATATVDPGRTAPPPAPDDPPHEAEIAALIERSYPIVQGVGIRCDALACEVAITPKPSSSADEDRIADDLLDGGLDRILGAYGYRATAPVVIDVMGGVNIGFRQTVTRR